MVSALAADYSGFVAAVEPVAAVVLIAFAAMLGLVQVASFERYPMRWLNLVFRVVNRKCSEATEEEDPKAV